MQKKYKIDKWINKAFECLYKFITMYSAQPKYINFGKK